MAGETGFLAFLETGVFSIQKSVPGKRQFAQESKSLWPIERRLRGMLMGCILNVRVAGGAAPGRGRDISGSPGRR